MRLTTAQTDRACGVIIGSAVGDALGAGYEFGSAPIGPDGPQMIGGGLGGFAPGEWTDDTAMTWPVAQTAAKGVDLRSPEALDAIAQGFLDWFATNPPDVGTQTRRVLSSVRGPSADSLAARMTAAAGDLHTRTGHTAGNGALMRTSPVALAHLADPAAVVEAAVAISALTHADELSGQACALWSLAIRHAVLEGEFDIRSGLEHLPGSARVFWAERIDEAETRDPGTFTPNGFVVTALQAAWSAIHHTPVPERMPCRHLQASLDTAIRIGNDTDTVAAIAGGLLGAKSGASAVPATWRRIVHGYPDQRAERLVELAQLAVTGGRGGAKGWPLKERIDYPGWGGTDTLVRHPHDEGVWLGGVDALDGLPEAVTAVVSLCLVGSEQVPKGVEHVVFRLIDQPAPDKNPNLDFVIADAARTVRALREEGQMVLLHCVAAQSRTPTVGAMYARLLGVPADSALTDVVGALPGAAPNTAFAEAVLREPVARS